MKAVIKLDVPDWQIGEEARVYFPDTMTKKGICEADTEELIIYKERWAELKETITELRDNNGKGTQKEICTFLANYMNVLEGQLKGSDKNDDR